MSATMMNLEELAAAGMNVTISANDLLTAIDDIRRSERKNAIADYKNTRSYTVHDVMRLLNMTDNGIRAAINRGAIPTVKVTGEGGTVYIPSTWVDEAMNKLKYGQTKNTQQ